MSIEDIKFARNPVCDAYLRRPAPDPIQFGRQVIETEAGALKRLARTLDHDFENAVRLLLSTSRRIVVSGMGKSGLVGRKIAATLSATGTPAIFIHPAEAAHGDLGMLVPGDLLLVLSNSGTTPELLPIIRHARSLQCRVVGVSGRAASPVIRASDVALLLPPLREACPFDLAPTTSTTMMLALGDALAVAVMGLRGVSSEQLGRLHPGGAIGIGLTPVEDVMHGGDRMPLVTETMPMSDVLVIMNAKSLGIAGVIDADGELVGVITDGDLRRHIDHLLTARANEVMTRRPKTIAQGNTINRARAMLTRNEITALFVVTREDPARPVGVIHIHDIGRLRA